VDFGVDGVLDAIDLLSRDHVRLSGENSAPAVRRHAAFGVHGPERDDGGF
jgi:hypothetical protein